MREEMMNGKDGTIYRNARDKNNKINFPSDEFTQNSISSEAT